jgi:hypothetical protein
VEIMLGGAIVFIGAVTLMEKAISAMQQKEPDAKQSKARCQ